MYDCLVTGGAGFIASHLIEELIRKGNTVCTIDDLSTGCLQNIEHLLGNDSFSFIEGNILDRSLMEKVVKKSQVIYHFAAAVGVKYIVENTLKAIQTNVHGTEIVLDLANIYKRKIMIASSSEVYGKNGKIPYKEDGDLLLGATTKARWSYACTKALDEFMALAYFNHHGLPMIIVRLFNTCGPRQTGQYGMVVPRFVRNAMIGDPLIIHGDGFQTRCFTYVGDVIRAITTLMETVEAVGKIFNIGSTQEIEIRYLAKRIIGLTGSVSSIEHISCEEAAGEGYVDVRRRVPDITKISKLIGWYPEVSLDDLLRIVIEYQRNLPITSVEVGNVCR